MREPEPTSGRAESPFGGPDDVVDELVANDFDWRDLVRSYPIPAVLLALAGGYLLGRRRGLELIERLSEYAARQVEEGVNEFLGDEVL